MRKTLAATVAAAVGLVLGGSMVPSAALAGGHDSSGHGSSGHGAPSYDPPPIPWGTCASATLQRLGGQCGFLTVPLDYAHPSGTKIKLAVSRINHTSSAADYQGIMLTNPGGPGGSGLTLSVLGQYVPDGVGNDYDWIGFDPRGVGASTPALNCNPHYFGPDRPFYVPTTQKRMSFWRHKAAAYARACGRSTAKRILPHMTSADNARDVNSIRKALGLSKISFYGFSWGTYLGQNFAQLFPHRVDRMILDGVVDPGGVWYQANLDQDRHFDSNMDVYWRYIARHDSAFGLGTDWKKIKSGFYAERRKLIKHPSDGGKLGPDELTDAVLSAGYYVYDWADIGAEYSDLILHNDGKALYARYADGNSGADNENGYAVYDAVQCTDTSWPGWTKTKRDNWRIHHKYPFETWSNAWYNAPCLNWPAKPHHKVAITGRHFNKKILLISETKDAATPYHGALTIRKRFKGASLVAGVGGTTHASSLSGVACVDNTIATYLGTGKVPPRKHGKWRADKYCPHVPAPQPETASARTAAPQAGLPELFRQLRETAQLGFLRG